MFKKKKKIIQVEVLRTDISQTFWKFCSLEIASEVWKKSGNRIIKKIMR